MKLSCPECGQAFEVTTSTLLTTFGSSKKYCSVKCQWRAAAKRNRVKRLARDMRRSRARGAKPFKAAKRITKTCPSCKNPFETHLSKDRKFCSKTCLPRAAPTYRFRVINTRQCLRCQKPFETLFKKRKYCSKPCLWSGPVKKLYRKLNGFSGDSRKRLTRHGVAFKQHINPHKVWLRDKGICHLCNKETPWELRGTYHPDAPEVDHLIPVSKAAKLGFAETAHSYEHVRISHRGCNIRRSNSLLCPLNGQPM